MADDNREYRNGFPVLSVTEAVSHLNRVLEDVFPFAWVRGELSGIKRSHQGHVYFAIKDGVSQLSCVCFRGDADRLRFRLEEGMQAICGGTLEVYNQRGSLQLLVRHAEPEGIGALALAFEQLKRRLENEGLFAPERKRRLPFLPRRVGVVTSPTGAVIRDILNVSLRRHPGIDVLLSPCAVQGDGAERTIVSALQSVVLHGVDAVIVARGGGSLEDLQAFNTEIVARAIVACPVPVVSAVGHETDFTIADFSADVRAPTPSAAAELAFPDREALLRQVANTQMHLSQRCRARLRGERQRFEAARRSLPHPQRVVRRQQQRLDELWLRLHRAVRYGLAGKRHRLNETIASLEGLNPMKILSRGYAVVEKNAHPVRAAAELAPGDRLRLRFHDGQVAATVDSADEDPRQTLGNEV